MTGAAGDGATRLVVVGGGPKAAAVAAKAHVLNDLGLASVEVHVLERAEVAAHWTGRHGWTDGGERLGTRVEKDVGFPYACGARFGAAGREIDRRMQAFSWHSHLIETGRYRQWVDTGLPNPTHRQFAAYLAWVLERATHGVRIERAEVTALTLAPGTWEVLWRPVPGGGTGRTVCDGVVLTGHGVPARLRHDPRVADRVITPLARRDTPDALGLRPGHRICLVGAGESAASFALHVRDTYGERVEVSVVAPSLPHSRAESHVENEVYSDPGAAGWKRLPEPVRRDFIARTDRGVISPAALTALSRAENVTFVLGRVGSVRAGPTGRARVLLEGTPQALPGEYDLVVNCTGGSPLAQVRALLSDASVPEAEARLGVSLSDGPALAASVDDSLALRGLRPRLHVPALAGLAQGPGFANLSSLGLLGDRVLQPYWRPRRPLPASVRPTAVPA